MRGFAVGVLVVVWIVGALAGVVMAVGGLGLLQCGLGADLAGCSAWPAWAEVLVGLGGIAFGLLMAYGFGASVLEELRRG